MYSRYLLVKILISAYLFVFFAFPFLQTQGNFGQKAIINKTNADSTVTLKLVFAGDVMEHVPQINSAYDSVNKTYDFNSCFSYVQNIIKQGDLGVCNLETNFGGLPYSGYPRFSCPINLASALKNAGFNLILTANNHCCDKYKKGLEGTINGLDSFGLMHTGTFKDSVTRSNLYPLIFEKNSIKLAILNCTYGTNGHLPIQPNIVNYIDTSQIRNDILKARNVSPDFIIMCIHWGNEYQREPDQSQTGIAEFLIKNGVNLVIGSHPHVLQKFGDVTTNINKGVLQGLVFYSMGNFISNQHDLYCDGSMLAEIVLTKNIKYNKTRIKIYGYIPTWVYKPLINNQRKYYVLPCNQFINDTNTFKMSVTDKESLKFFYKDTKTHLDSTFEIKR